MSDIDTEIPPAYTAPVIYDETHRGKHYMQPRCDSMGNLANLMAHLPNHSSTTDGSFSICVAAGNCTLVSKKLYESIPAKHRPPLDTHEAGQSVQFLIGSNPALGSTIMPILLQNAVTGQRFCIKLYALVIENLLMGVFIGKNGVKFMRSEAWGGGRVIYEVDFGTGERIHVMYEL